MVSTIRRITTVLGVLTASALLLFNFSLTNAQENEGGLALSVSPFKFEPNVNPGDVFEDEIRVTNNADTAQDVTIDVRNFLADGEEGGVDLTENDTTYSVADWVTVSKEASTIPAKASETYGFTINVPEDAEPGSHLGSIIFKTEAPDVEGQSGATVSQEIGALLLVTVSGDITEEISVASFEAGELEEEDGAQEFDEKSFFENGPVTFETRFQNDGNVHLAPTGTITIKNMFGSVVETLQLDQQNVLPDSVRRTLATWDPGFSVGKYTAELSATAGDTAISLSDEVSFTIFPWKVLVPVLLAVVALVVVLVKGRERIASAFRALEGKNNTSEKPVVKQPKSSEESTEEDSNSKS